MQILPSLLLLTAAVQGAVVKVTQTRVHTETVAPLWHTNLVVDYTTVTKLKYTSTLITTVFGTPTTYAVESTSTVSLHVTQGLEDVQQVTNIIPVVEIPETVQNTPTVTPGSSLDIQTPLTSTSILESSSIQNDEPLLVITSIAASPVEANGESLLAITTSIESIQIINSLDDSVGPTLILTVPLSTGLWLIENVSTYTSEGVCVVSYDYYDSEEVETVTLTRTVYATVTAV